MLSEHLSSFEIPVLKIDIKGDFSKEGEEELIIIEPHAKINIPYSTSSFSLELLTLPEQNSVRLRATISEFGPVLFSRILNLNYTQASVRSIIFKYCNDK